MQVKRHNCGNFYWINLKNKWHLNNRIVGKMADARTTVIVHYFLCEKFLIVVYLLLPFTGIQHFLVIKTSFYHIIVHSDYLLCHEIFF